jgi:cell division inhibitor SepF
VFSVDEVYERKGYPSMAGALRKMGVYLGLVEEDADHVDEYDEYDYEEAAPVRDRPDQTRTLQPVREDRPAAVPAAAPAVRPVRSEARDTRSARQESVDSYRITTLHPRNYNDARTVGEYFREATPVIMNLTDMDDADAKRLVDFSAGLIFGLHGTIERVTAKVFLLSPANVVVTAEEKARLAEGGFFNQS